MLTNVDKYIEKFATKTGESVSGRSHYYQVGDKIIRVSDHIGNNSDGSMHIIVKPNGYLIHHPGTGTINICTYREVQEFIRSIRFLPICDTVKQNLIIPSEDTSTILGVPIQAFTDGQMTAIKKMAEKAKKGRQQV